ncbi:MAG: c-type cytochrome [Phycisphaerales bacterium]|nr:MAG: c-type cytochrome [Phycisphaerales bacterium]
MSRSTAKQGRCARIVALALYLTAGVRGADYLSPSALVADSKGGSLYIAEATAKQVAVLDLALDEVTRTFSVPDEPSGLALSRDGSRLYVTCGSAQGRVHVAHPRSGESLDTLPVGHTPTAPVLSPDGKRLYVCNSLDDTVSVIDTEHRREIARIRVSREPVAASVTPDAKWLYVGNQLPDGPADAGPVACKVSVINIETLSVDVSIVLPNGSTGLRGLAVSPDGSFVFVSHLLSRYTVPTTQLERGWINTNAITIIDAADRKLIETVLLDDVDYGAANPWAVACTADGKYLCVTHAGTHELSLTDVDAMLDKIKSHRERQSRDARSSGSGPGASYGYGGESVSDIPNQLSFLHGIRRRVRLGGRGPRALVVVDHKAYVAEYFTDSITMVDMGHKSRVETTSIALGPKKQMTAVRRGEMLFHDALLCFQGWQSCASCHPADGRPDALNWDLLNDGLGNPKNTKSLLLAHETPPAMITGVRDTAEAAVRAGIRHIQFATCPEEDAAAIDEYLKSLKPAPSPYLVKGELSGSAQRGRQVFEKAKCSSCHNGPLHTDLKKYDVGTGRGREKGLEFDTPTLVEVWRTAPYLYDGRAVTIKEVLTKYNPDDKHGATSDLTERQINDLAEFVLSQ